MLVRKWLSRGGYVAVMVLSLFNSTACLLPPEGPRPPAPDFPPHIDFGLLRPAQGFVRLQLGSDCSIFEAVVERIRDEDSPSLRERWVVNNNLPNARVLRERTLNFSNPGAELNSTFRVLVVEDLDADGVAGLVEGETVVLSFFVTDAERFSASEDRTNPGEPVDFGAVAEGAGATVEARWTFTFGEVGICP
ncbi:MAG: hypothetical protein AAFZ18_06730 [Myxococcota bacterium]